MQPIMKVGTTSIALSLAASCIHAFAPPISRNEVGKRIVSLNVASTTTTETDRAARKAALLEILGQSSEAKPSYDPVLADPETKRPIKISSKGPILLSTGSSGVAVSMKAESSLNTYAGRTDTYLNLLEPIPSEEEQNSNADLIDVALLRRNLASFLPPPLRSALAGFDEEYIPMRDLFTSPAVSAAYERGWRQGFAQAGFPGADKEFEMALEYFAPAKTQVSTLVDMSCATGLFTRRFAKSGEYNRVIGCDYSESMLVEARRRIAQGGNRLNSKENGSSTQLDLVRCDVGQIPMQDNSVDALHAGAAMHCWPDLQAAVSEIYRVLKPGGRYFASTFLSSYFRTLQLADSEAVSQKAFQYFGSTEELRKLIISGGFKEDKVQVELLKPACVVIRCEK